MKNLDPNTKPEVQEEQQTPEIVTSSSQNDSGIHSDEDWESKTISERDLSEG